MAPRENTRGMITLSDPSEIVSDPGLDLSLSLSVGGTSQKPVQSGRSSSLMSDMDSRYLIGGSSPNSDSSATTTTSTTQNTCISNTGNDKIFPKMPLMPCVTVKGSRVTGFLYRVTSTTDIFIVCACHGRFFSPAGFVEHAGWINVINPLRLIVVKPY